MINQSSFIIGLWGERGFQENIILKAGMFSKRKLYIYDILPQLNTRLIKLWVMRTPLNQDRKYAFCTCLSAIRWVTDDWKERVTSAVIINIVT